jgi:5'-phosphate synthase pdxT subunit
MADKPVVGVLALQGAFREHISSFRSIGIEAIEVKNAENLARCSGLVIPGGESTAMGILAEQNNGEMMRALKQYIAKRPTWGVCAGLIMMADTVQGQKSGGQSVFGGLGVTVSRNMYGSQLASFEAPVSLKQPEGSPLFADIADSFSGMFIRAPGIVSCDKPDVEVIAVLSSDNAEHVVGVRQVICSFYTVRAVADEMCLRQGKLMATSFHPELVEDARFHRAFYSIVEQNLNA